MSNEPPAPVPAAGSPSGRFVGLVLISIGVLWLTLTGLCTVVMFVAVLSDSSTIYFSDVMIVLSFVIPSALIGSALYFLGRLLRPKA